MTWQRDKPIIGVVGFNLFTLFVFITAPVAWKTDNLFAVYFLVLFCQLMVFVGFRIGSSTRPAPQTIRAMPFFSGDRLFDVLLAIYLLTFPISYAYRMEFGPFDIAGMVARLVAGFRDPHFAYAWSIDKTSMGPGGPIPWSVYFAVSIFDQVFFAAGFLQWRRLTWMRRVAFAIFVVIDLFYWLGIATTFGVVALATTFALSTMFWAARAGGRWGRPAGNVPLLLLLLAGAITFFSYNLYRRSNLAEIDLTHYEVAHRPILLNHPSLALVPRTLWPSYITAVSYFAQGYYHASLAFDLDFRPTGFVGNNPALIAIAKKLGVDVWEDTYMHRLQSQGVEEYGAWHSAYTWYACDVSFLGVPIVLFILGCLFGFSWALGMRGDFLSQLVFIVLGNMLVFLFANNTYLSSVFGSFIVLLPFWILTRVFSLPLSRPVRWHTLPVRSNATGQGAG